MEIEALIAKIRSPSRASALWVMVKLKMRKAMEVVESIEEESQD